MMLSPLESGLLKTSELHQIHFMTFGNKNGIPLLNFHGGPGSHTTPKIAEALNQDKFYIILFDQRGCGQSVPLGETYENTTDDLITDASKLLAHLGVKQALITGGSWGSTLALRFAETFPNKTLGLAIYSVSLLRRKDIDWYFNRARILFPAEYDTLYHDVKLPHPSHVLQQYENSNYSEQQNIAAALTNLSTALGKGLDDAHYIAPQDLCDSDLAAMHIFLHYAANGYFLEKNEILKNIKTIRGMPCIIVHGMMDYSCPIEGPYLLAQALKRCSYYPIPMAGHFSNTVRSVFFEKINKFDINGGWK